MQLRLIASCVIALSASACGTTTQSATASTTATEATAHAELPTVSIDDVVAAIARNDGSIAIFDANSPETFAEHHVPGATWVQYDGVTAEVLPQDHAKLIVFYCGNERCRASHTAGEQARALGYTNVAVMSAGIRGWIEAGKPTEATPATSAAAQ